MNPIKRLLLTLLATLPLGAVSYAAEFENQVDMGKWTPEQIKAEFDYRLQANELPEKYYEYLGKLGIVNMDDLTAEKNLNYYQRMLKEFKADHEIGVYRMSGALSIGTAF